MMKVKESRRSKLADAAEELVASASGSSFDPAIFFEKFELVARIPKAIETLRFTIIELATLGRITEQVASEGCGRSLRELIKEKHTQLRSQKVIKSKPIQHLNSDNLPPLPENWDWTSLGEICDYAYSNKVESSDIPEDAWLLDLEDVEKETSRILRRKSFHESPSLSTKSEFAQGDVLYCKLRPYLNKVVVANESGYCTTEIIPIRTFGLVAPEYVALAMRRPTFVAYANSKSFGMNLPRLSTNDARLAPIPLPPIAEQKRIVAKVDELMGLCDRLEALEAERKERHASLSRAAFARFADSPTPTNLQFLFHNSFDVEPGELRKSILSMAVRGSISKQEPGDEPADQLISRITKAKASLVSEGEVGKSKPFSLDESSLPFTLPSGWTWCTLDSLCEVITKGSSPKWQGVSYVDKEGGLLFITSENVGNYHLRKLDDLKYVEPKFNEMETRSILKRGDILITLVGASIGRTAVYDLDEIANINQAVAKIRVVRGFDADLTGYLLHYLNSPVAIESMLSSRVVTAQPNISLTNAKEFPIPLPPLAEQKRIVAKVDELMALVDQLEQQLAHSRTLGQQLLEAVVANLTNTSNQLEVVA